MNPEETYRNPYILTPGFTLGHYKILCALGLGGFSITYLAEDTDNSRRVVVKEYLPQAFTFRHQDTKRVSPASSDSTQNYEWGKKRFLDRVCTLTRLNHPNIVRVIAAFEALGTAYYVMPWIEGQELHRVAPAATDITEEWLLPILRQLLEALKYLHSKDILHRDIKPGNILLREDGTPILIEFLTSDKINDEYEGPPIGFPHYSPPEHFTHRGSCGPWTDLYSLGATCYRLITGENPPGAFDRFFNDPLPKLAANHEFRKRFSRKFLESIDHALKLKAKDRMQNASEWLAALPRSARKPYTRRTSPAKKLALSAVLLLALGGTALGAYLICQAQPQQQLKSRGILPGSYNTALINAAAEGDVNCLKLLLAAGADANTRSPNGNTPLYLAAWRGHTECLRLLLTTPGIKVNTISETDIPPLCAATYQNHSECVRLLLAAPGIDVNGTDEHGYTALHWAADKGNTECMRQLLAAPKIRVNATTRDGVTPLHQAAEEGRISCVQLLLAAPGINVTPICNGNTPYQLAVKKGHTAIAELLRAAGGK